MTRIALNKQSASIYQAYLDAAAEVREAVSSCWIVDADSAGSAARPGRQSARRLSADVAAHAVANRMRRAVM